MTTGLAIGVIIGLAYLLGYWRGAKYAIKACTDQIATTLRS